MVATSTRKGVTRGFDYALAWVVGDYGSVLGQAGTSLAQDAVSGAFLMNHPRTAGLTANTPGEAIAYGGNAPMVKISAGDTLLQQFELEYGAVDLDLLTLLDETSIDATVSERLVVAARNPLKLSTLTWGFALVNRVETITLGADGPVVYSALVLPRCEVAVSGVPPFNTEEGSPNFSYPAITITPKPSDKFPGGLAYVGGSGDFDTGVAQGLTDAFWMFSRDNPVYIDGYKSNGIATTFDLTFTPASTGTSADDGNLFIQYDTSAGSAAAITPSDITGKTVTIAAPEANDIVTSIYQVALSSLKLAG